MAATVGMPPANLALQVAPGGKTECLYRNSLPWSRTAKVVSSCECLTAERPSEDTGPTILRLDLSHEPDAHSFAPTLRLLDAAGAELARLVVDVEIGSQP